jgi:hypothetical protein
MITVPARDEGSAQLTELVRHIALHSPRIDPTPMVASSDPAGSGVLDLRAARVVTESGVPKF